MDTHLLLAFLAASIVVIVIPGPNVLLIISTSAMSGARRGLQTVLGTSSAMVIQLSIAAIASTWVVRTLAEGFYWLRWFGVVYLMYLGTMQIWRALRPQESARPDTGAGSFGRGFIVSLTNPKTIIFFGTFFPQFIESNADYISQFILLSSLFIALATFLDGIYALMASRLTQWMDGKGAYQIRRGVSGALYIGLGIWLASARKSA